jgi:predicted  nucleic acid-binding Zn-ribbon protein
MEQVEAARADVQEKKKALAEEEKAIQGDIVVLEQRLVQIGTELAKLKQERAEAAKEVDSQGLARYERIFKHKDRALVHIEEGVCGGCHMNLPPYVIHGAKKMDATVVCDFCGRMLY